MLMLRLRKQVLRQENAHAKNPRQKSARHSEAVGGGLRTTHTNHPNPHAQRTNNHHTATQTNKRQPTNTPPHPKRNKKHPNVFLKRKRYSRRGRGCCRRGRYRP